MLYEYALISVVIACGYWGWFFVRRQPTGTPTFGLMQLGAAALAGLGLLNGKYPHRALGVAGAIGVGAGACLLILAPLVRWLARRLAHAERLGIASRLLEVADLLAPGSGAREEKAVLASMADIRDGRVEPTIDALAAAKRTANTAARRAIDERIALLYLAAYRWEDAIAHVEANMQPLRTDSAVVPALELAARTADGADPTDRTDHASDEVAERGETLRDGLGIAPPVWVELLGAYGRTGNLDQAARMVARLEDVAAERPDASIWIHRARLMFLALAGRPDAVRALLGGKRAAHMSPAARTYWMAVAHEHHGDRIAAASEYARARRRSRGRPREMIDRAVAGLPTVQPTPLSPLATAVVARVETAPMPAPVRMARVLVRPWATWVLTAIPIAVAAAVALVIGPSAEPGVLVRDGAMVRGFVAAGEWWRLVSCVAIHVGIVHLAVNSVGLWFLGRTAEDLFGHARTFAIFGLAGIGGAVASYLGSPAGISAGASGAVFGLLGAIFIELTWHRARYRAAWRRGMWGGLVVVTIAQLGIGFAYPVIDQWAHAVGLGTGMAVGALLSPHAPWHRAGNYLARALAVGLGALAIAVAVLVGRTSVERSFASQPRVLRAVDGVVLAVPERWDSLGTIADPDGLVFVDLHAAPHGDLVAQQHAWAERAAKLAVERELTHVSRVESRVFAVPVGWVSEELLGAVDDELGNRQPFRLLVASREVGATTLQLVVMAPESVARAAPRFFTQLVASARPE